MPPALAQPAIPRFLYGTAWKESDTERLTRLALQTGFVGIDTANQRKHYFEAGVGAAIRAAIAARELERDALFLQTKFTFVDGQDHRLPYDPAAAIATQVEQSFESSLEHLGTSWIDSYVLHGPTQRRGLAKEDWDAWRAMERLATTGRARHLGISNVTLAQLQALCASANIRPTFVQNRCYARTGWDREVRAFCREHGITYQGFSLLTANTRELGHAALTQAARRLDVTPAEVVFRFAIAVGMLPLTGTSNREHMRSDLDCVELELTRSEIEAIEHASG